MFINVYLQNLIFFEKKAFTAELFVTGHYAWLEEYYGKHANTASLTDFQSSNLSCKKRIDK